MINVERIDLLPGFVAARRRARRLLGATSLVAAAAAVACGLTFVVQGFTLGDAHAALDVQNAENAALNAEVSRLADLEAMQLTLADQQAALTALFADEVRWSLVLADLQAVVPRDTWLTGMTISMGPSDRGIASIQFQGTTFTHPDVADWLQRLDRVPGFVDPYFSIASKTEVEGRTVVSFSSTVTVTDLVLRTNQPGAAR